MNKEEPHMTLLVTEPDEGEFVYLRGDRHDPARLIPLVLVS